MRLLAAAAVLLAAGCGARDMYVRAQPLMYSPAMSSTVGIALKPIFVPPPGITLIYRWYTNFGYFVSWKPPAEEVVPRGTDFVSTPGELFWTYDPKLAPVEKPVVAIVVEALDARTESIVARRQLTLDWDGDTARVRE